jgi:hypothetical protein
MQNNKNSKEPCLLTRKGQNKGTEKVPYKLKSRKEKKPVSIEIREESGFLD